MIRHTLSLLLTISILCSCSVSNKVNKSQDNVESKLESVSFELDTDDPHPMTNLTKKIGLEGADKIAVKAFISEHRTDMNELMMSNNSGVSSLNKMTELDKIRDEKIKAIISEDQFIAYQGLLLESLKWPYLHQGKTIGLDGQRLDEFASIMVKYQELFKDEMSKSSQKMDDDKISKIENKRIIELRKLLTKEEYAKYKNNTLKR